MAHPYSSLGRAALIGGLVALLALPLVVGSYPRYIVTMWMIFAVAAMGLNIPMGLAGIYSFGHGAFLLIGAYGTAVAMVHWGWPFWAALPFAVVCAAIVGVLIGLPSLRLSGFSLAIVTFAFGYVLFHVVKTFQYTGGPQGLFLPDIPLVKTFGDRFLYYLTLALFLATLFAASSIAKSKTGRALRTLASSEIVAASLGINPLRYRIIAFVLSAIFGAVAGGLVVLVTGYAAPETYSPELSIDIFAAVIIGGAGTLAGPLLGALFSVLVPELTQGARGLGQIIYALLFCLVVTLFPSGLAGQFKAAWLRLKSSGAGIRTDGKAAA